MRACVCVRVCDRVREYIIAVCVLSREPVTSDARRGYVLFVCSSTPCPVGIVLGDSQNDSHTSESGEGGREGDDGRGRRREGRERKRGEGREGEGGEVEREEEEREDVRQRDHYLTEL